MNYGTKYKGKYEILIWYKSKKAKYPEKYFSHHKKKSWSACMGLLKNMKLSFRILHVVIKT